MERSGCPDRALLRGLGEEILILVSTNASRAELMDWTKVPRELSNGEVDFLRPNECCQMRRRGEDILNFVMENASHEQWLNWLQIPLQFSLLASKKNLAEKLVGVGGRLSVAAGRETETVTPGDYCPSFTLQTPTQPCSQTLGAAVANPPVPLTVSPSCCNQDPPEDSAFAAAAFGASAALTPCTSSSCFLSVPPKVATTSMACCKGGSYVLSPSAAAASLDQKALPPPCAPPVGNGGSSNNGNADSGIPIIDASEGAALVITDNLCLHRATMARDLSRMRNILVRGVDINATDLWNCTALHRASEQDSAEPVRLLIAAGLDVGARDMEGYSPLHFAAARGAESAIVDLLAAGSCLSDRGNNGDSPLHSAVRFLSVATVRILLESDADETARNEDGHTPMDITGVLPDGREIEDQPDPRKADEIKALLAGAPAERKARTWKRRAWLVVLRARAQATDFDSVAATTEGHAFRQVDTCCAKMENASEQVNLKNPLRLVPWDCSEGSSDKGALREGTSVEGEFWDFVNRTTGLTEDGVFQKIVRFL